MSHNYPTNEERLIFIDENEEMADNQDKNTNEYKESEEKLIDGK